MFNALTAGLPGVAVYLGVGPATTVLPAVLIYPGAAAPQSRAVSGRGHTRILTTRVVCAAVDVEACKMLADRVIGLIDGPVYRADFISAPLFSDGAWSATIEFVSRFDRINV